MADSQKPQFQIVTDRKDLALRKIRSFVASVGGAFVHWKDTGSFFAKITSQTSGVIFVDTSLGLRSEQWSRLAQTAAAVVICDPGKRYPEGRDVPNFAVYAEADLNALFESQIVKTHLAKLTFSGEPITLPDHLAWGSASLQLEFRDWNVTALLKAIKRKFFMGSGCYDPTAAFFQCLKEQLAPQNITPEHLQFCSDGVVSVSSVAISQSCDITRLVSATAELQGGQVVVNKLQQGRTEIAFITWLTDTVQPGPWLGVPVILNQTAKRAGGDRPKVYRLDFERAG